MTPGREGCLRADVYDLLCEGVVGDVAVFAHALGKHPNSVAYALKTLKYFGHAKVEEKRWSFDEPPDLSAAGIVARAMASQPDFVRAWNGQYGGAA